MDVIGRGTWIDKLASNIVEREKKLGRSLDPLRVESGLGASGIPHVGSLGDAVRAYAVKLALGDQGYRSELIAFSDDLDGLRKVPAGLPSWLEDHLGKPVSSIPDPFDCHGSYGAHMSSILTNALDRCGIKYVFRSGTQTYAEGILDAQIAKILDRAQEIGMKIAEMVGQTKYEEILPYFPICENCGRLYVAEALRYTPEEKKVAYRCRGTEIGGRSLKGCGYQGDVRIDRPSGKLSWKAEFAARWSALDIRFEAYGKDIADSVKINDWVSDEILGHPHPYHARYEMFLDKSGRKISKSAGNVFTPQMWLKYGSKQSLLLLMLKRMVGTRSLSPEDIPTYMDEYDRLEETYFSLQQPQEEATKTQKLSGLYEYVNLLDPPKGPDAHVPYRMLVQLVSYAPKDSLAEYVSKRLLAYGTIKESTSGLEDKIFLARNWVEDFASLEPTKLRLSSNEESAISELSEILSIRNDPKVIQSEIFEVARRHDIEPRNFFVILYRILIGSDRGPRLGPYITDIGMENAVKILKAHVGRD